MLAKTGAYIFFWVLFACNDGIRSQPCAVDKSKFTWFYGNGRYYFRYSDEAYFGNAQCICSSMPGMRLAIFDEGDGDMSRYGDVTAYLSQRHPYDQLWVDATRNMPGENYTWANGCPFPINTAAWRYGEPNSGDTFVRIVQSSQKWLYRGRYDNLHRPFCQSWQAPPNYLPTPPVLEWVSLGALGFRFGFSSERLALEDAKLACERQAGSVYLAHLDTLYDEVADYILNNHPNKTYWLDAVDVSTINSTHNNNNDDISANFTFPFAWPAGTNINTTYVASSKGVVMVNENNTMKLSTSPAVLPFHFICMGHPDPEQMPSSGAVSGDWISLGSPGRKFIFSNVTAKYTEARDACAAETGNTRLAILDTLMPDVVDWIYTNHRYREFWVGGSRPDLSQSDLCYWYHATQYNLLHADCWDPRAQKDWPLVWEDGKTIEPTFWLSGEPDANDLAARLKFFGSIGHVILAGTGSIGTNRYFVCEEIPDVTLEWRLLGSPQKLFGFSRTPSWGLEWSRDACERQLGDVRLASLDTHFNEVKGVIETYYSNDQFWVDVKQSADGTFRWGSGETVSNTGWLLGEPDITMPQARMTSSSVFSVVGLASAADPFNSFYFICEGRPATPSNAILTYPTPGCNSSVNAPVVQTTTELNTPANIPVLACNYSTVKIVNVSAEVVVDLVQKIKTELLLDTNNLTSSVRKKTSAKDNRTSAQTAGYLAITVLILTFALLLASDVITIIHVAVEKVSR